MFEISFNADAFTVKAEKLLANVPEALKAAGLVMLAEAAKTIAQGGSGWAPFKRLPKRPHHLLYDTGHLIQSLQYGNANNIFNQDGDTLTVGSNLQYAAAQQYGYPKHNLPARPYLFVDSRRAGLARSAFARRLMQGV